MSIPDLIKKIFNIPYYYRAEVVNSTIILNESGIFDAGKYKATSISFVIPDNTGLINYDTVNIKGIPLFAGDAMREFKNEIPHLDKTIYEIAFQGVAGTQPVLHVYITHVSKYVAVQPKDIIPCDTI